MVLENEILRRNRKALLSDLSSLVKSSKRIQEHRQHTFGAEPEPIRSDVIDEMLLKAFKIVTRGVRFLDAFVDGTRSQDMIDRTITALMGETYDPSTPPADSTSFEHAVPSDNAGSRRVSERCSTSGASGLSTSEEQTKLQSYQRTSNVFPPTTKSTGRHSVIQMKRMSLSHRLSTARPYLEQQRQNYVSELLGTALESFISCLGSLVGRLNLTNTSKDLFLSIRQAIAAGKSLGTIIEALCLHDLQSEASLQHVRDTMYQCINQLVIAARECVRPISTDDDDAMMPRDHQHIKTAATACVVASGECVARAKSVIEIIGDFELEPSGLGIDVSTFGANPADSPGAGEEAPVEPASRPPPPPPVTIEQEKPLPSVTVDQEKPLPSVAVVQEKPLPIVPESADIRTVEISSEAQDDLAPLPKIASPLTQQEFSLSEQNPVQVPDNDLVSSRSDSFAVSSGTASTYMGSLRDSESSMVSQTSTRATTPDMGPYGPNHKLSSSINSISESQCTMADDIDDAESKMLERTFAHELLFNKEQLVTGGSLPALVERLTTHDSTPDAMFVSTFYLTFRLFATPVTFAEALVDRFDYVTESPHIAAPVRLRVYNVFKGWLESHWRNASDEEALAVIQSFAEHKLFPVLPAAGRRLLELTDKVSSTDGPLVPRLVSSMGKTSTSIAQYISPDTPMPAPVMSKSQMNNLKVWKMGGASPSVLDFSPLELARQLTMKEMNIFCTIMPEELLASEWMKKSGSNAINVKAMSTLSTDLSNFVADTILQSESDAKKRAVILKHWIKIASECLELNNYDSLMAIICSLNSSMITRLKRTWDMVSQKRKDMLKVLQDIVEPTKNHAVLRQRLHDHVPPCLPFVGTYLTDLTFVDIGNPSTKQLPGSAGENGKTVINFDKHSRTAKIIGELQRFQIPYRLVEVPELQEWIQAQIIRVRSSNDSNNIQQYYRKSLLLEPRQTAPVDPQSLFSAHLTPTISKDKFDLFSWTHSSREKPVLPTPNNT